MPKSNNNNKFLRLRSKYSFFAYEGFDYQYSGSGLKAQFHFNLSGKYSFHPTLIYPFKEFFVPENNKEQYMENLLFNIGMVEMISYWKAACPKKIIIRKHFIEDEQIKWWKKLYFRGLGEFFYLNSIDTNEDDFVDIECEPGKEFAPFSLNLHDAPLIPIGGGKDSVVTFELLKPFKGNIPLILNPREATRGTVKKKGIYYDSIIEVFRSIDPTLLELNDKGFLNGHTPFSALLAFITALAAILSGKKYIALSNESSANESTVPGSEINHQYSKSVEFEKDFREYMKKYICPDVEYFSFLRPLNELQIAKLFSRFPLYFDVFRSCNAGSKTGVWCGKCSKCLFTYIILSPFIPSERMKQIFGKDMFADQDLIPVFDELTGRAKIKPFDCVGTTEEVNAAVQAVINGFGSTELPVLLEHYKSQNTLNQHFADIKSILGRYDTNNFLPEPYEKLLKTYLHD